jgi:DNA-binding MarR family transcriptional regulator
MEATAVTPKVLAEELLELWAHLMRGSSRQMFAVLGELDLTMTQMKTLSMLDDCVEEVSVKELSERLGLSLPATSRTVDGLLRRGLLSRHEDAEDRRVKRVRISADGRKVVNRIVTARLQGLEAFASSLTDDQRAALMAALAGLPHSKKDHA